MKHADKYCTVDQAKKLKGLGIVQGKSERFWFVGDTGNNVNHLNITGTNFKSDDLTYSAFDVSELAEMLPDYVLFKKDSLRQEGYVCMAVNGHVRLPDTLSGTLTLYAITLPEVMADMLLLLLNSECMKAEDCNKSLIS